jgi:DNA-binding winged helix-turn-helix (wHTH) protein
MDPAPAPAAIEFGRFRILPHCRELLAEGQPLDLGGRAFDVLMALIEASEAVVSKDALLKRGRPDQIVEENSLQAQIAALRRAFGAGRDLIRTLSGCRYQFTGALRVLPERPKACVGFRGSPHQAFRRPMSPDRFRADRSGGRVKRAPGSYRPASARHADRRRRHRQDTARCRDRA